MAGRDGSSSQLVVAVALFDQTGRVLLCKRPAGKPMAGLWELPGGKIEANETAEAALVRELAEEVGLKICETDLMPLTFASHKYDDFYLLMPVFACTVWRGVATAREGQSVKWVAPDVLCELDMPPADLPLLPAIKRFAVER